MLEMLVLSLSTWRLTSLFVYEDGPFGVFDKIRAATVNSKFYSELFSCFLCMSVWCGTAAVLIYWLIPVLSYALAASGAAILIEWTSDLVKSLQAAAEKDIEDGTPQGLTE